jgi:hypothetical protein
MVKLRAMVINGAEALKKTLLTGHIMCNPPTLSTNIFL